jgi:hypothetical protein
MHLQLKTNTEISIFSNDSHLELMVGLSDIIFLKGNYLWTNPANFGLICFSGDDFNVIFFYLNKKNLHYRFNWLKEKFQKNLENMLKYLLPCSCNKTIELILTCNIKAAMDN